MARKYKLILNRILRISTQFEYGVEANSEREAIQEMRRRLDNNIPGKVVENTCGEEDEVYPLEVIDESGRVKELPFYWNSRTAHNNAKTCRCGKPARYLTAHDGGFCRACAKKAGLLL